MSHVALVGLRSRCVNLLATPETSFLRCPWFRTLTTCHIRPRSSIAEQQYARARLPRYAPSTSRKQAFGGSGTCTSFSTSSRLSARHNRKLPSLVPKDRGVKELQQTRTLTWRDYDPEGGLPLPSGDLPRATIVEIFGDGVNRAAGNWIIRLMNYRRQSGSLIEHGLDFPVDNDISRDMAYKALVYLRQTNPEFNESEAGASWADEQVEQLEGDFVDRASGSRLYEQEEPQEESVLVRLRKLNDAKWKEADRKDAERQAEEEQQALAQARADGQDSAEQQSGPQGLSSSSAPESPRSVALHKPLQKAWLQPVERKPWVKYYEQQAQIVKDNIVPEMSTIRRLGPSALVVLAVLGSCYYLHENYVPPPRQARLLPDVPPAVATIGAIIALNLAIAIGYRMPPLWRFFNRYFVCAPGYPVPSSIFLSMFAHQKMTHLFFNSVLFFTFGQFLHEDVGRGTFLAIYLSSGVSARYISFAVDVLRKNWLTYTVGSSGAVYGVLAAACLLRASNDVQVMGYNIPMAGSIVLAVWTVFELIAMRRPNLARLTDFKSHLTGLACGALLAIMVRFEAGRKQVAPQKHDLVP